MARTIVLLNRQERFALCKKFVPVTAMESSGQGRMPFTSQAEAERDVIAGGEFVLIVQSDPLNGVLQMHVLFTHRPFPLQGDEVVVGQKDELRVS